MVRNNIIILAFNAKLSDGCDYATQTMRILGRQNNVFALLLGEPITWKNIFENKIIEKKYASILLHPIFIIPGHRFSFIRSLNYFFNAIALRIFLTIRYIRKKKLLWFFEPQYAEPVFYAMLGYHTFYDCIDFFDHDRFLPLRAQIMVCNSQTLADLYKSKRPDIEVVPLGFAMQNFSRYQSFSSGSTRVVGFIGALHERIDIPLFSEVIRRLPEIQFKIIGPIQQNAKVQLLNVLKYSNVRYVDFVSKSKIGSFIQSFHIGIIPYDISSSFNKNCYPMKIMEYFWFGLPVITTDIKELRSFKSVTIAHTAREWVNAINRILKANPVVTEQKDSRAISIANSWDRKIDAISDVLHTRTMLQ